MRWRFEPFWLKRGNRRRPQINAKAETLLESPMFRDSVAAHRCLIPADGFYEWQAAPDRNKPQPLHIRLEGGELFAFAGIYTGGPEQTTPATRSSPPARTSWWPRSTTACP